MSTCFSSFRRGPGDSEPQIPQVLFHLGPGNGQIRFQLSHLVDIGLKVADCVLVLVGLSQEFLIRLLGFPPEHGDPQNRTGVLVGRPQVDPVLVDDRDDETLAVLEHPAGIVDVLDEFFEDLAIAVDLYSGIAAVVAKGLAAVSSGGPLGSCSISGNGSPSTTTPCFWKKATTCRNCRTASALLDTCFV